MRETDFRGFLSQQVAAVTSEQISELRVGRLCPQGGTQTGVCLGNDEKSLLVVFFKLRSEYMLARSRFERLTPADQKVAPLAELGQRYQECKLTLDLFWICVRTRMLPHTAHFCEMGFDQSGRIWCGPVIRRDSGDFSNHFDETCMRL
jgi:hypothetical protein